MGKQITYADSGVDNEAKEDTSRILYEAARQTWENRKGRLGEILVPFDDFSGIRFINIAKLPEGTVMGEGADGIGTKPEISERIGNFTTNADNLFAMFLDDVLVRGGEPVLVTTVLDVNSLKNKGGAQRIEEVRQLARGYVEAAKAGDVCVISGETAELGARVGGYSRLPGFFTRARQGLNYIIRGQGITDSDFHLNWSGTCTWFANEKRLFTGREIQAGDSLVGLADYGFGSNGLSLVRKIGEQCFGREWHLERHRLASGETKTLGELVLTPCTIYTKSVVDMYGGYNREPKTEVHGVAHITGGGLPEKLKRVLRPSNLGAELTNPMAPPEIMSYFQRIGNVSDEEAYKTWHMGPRMVVVTPKPGEVIAIAKEHGIHGEYIGEVTREKGIRIRNRGAFSSEGKIVLYF